MIVREPGWCSGYAHVAGTKLPVWAIVSQLSGATVDELIAGYPFLTKAAVQAAVDYYATHKDAVDNDRRDAEAA